MKEQFKFSEQKFRTIVGFLLLFVSLAVPFFGRDVYFGYNDQYYFLQLVVLFPLALLGAGLLAEWYSICMNGHLSFSFGSLR